MKIGILGAMLEEVSCLKEAMTIEREHSLAGRIYYEGRMGSAEVVLVFCRWGKVASSSTVTTLIDRFASELIIFTGVAGAVDPSLNVGDVVVANGLYQHDMDARPIFDRFQIPLTEARLCQPDPALVQAGMQATHEFLGELREHVEKNILDEFSISAPKVIAGVIASGDQFVADPSSHEGLRFPGEDVLAVEMEGAAVAQVCVEHQIPFIVIRTISDKADDSAAVDFQKFVGQVASRYSWGIIEKFLRHLVSR